MHLLPEGKKACRHCFDSFPQVTSQNEFTAAHSAEVLLIYGSALSRSASNLRLFCVAVCVNLLKLDIKNMDEIELSATNPKSCDGICGKEAKGCGLFYAPPPYHRYPANICQVHNSANHETFFVQLYGIFSIFFRKYFILFDTPMVKKKSAKLFFLYESKIQKSKNVNKLFLSNSRI